MENLFTSKMVPVVKIATFPDRAGLGAAKEQLDGLSPAVSGGRMWTVGRDVDSTPETG